MASETLLRRLETVERRLDRLERQIGALERLAAELRGVERTLGELKVEVEQMQEA